jgi:hypothetical protein
MKKILVLLSVILAFSFIGWCVDHHRWAVKIKPNRTTNSRSLKLTDVTNLSDPPGVTFNDSRYESELIPEFHNALGLKEGDLIKIKGYMHLVAFERNDDDYHIQISNKKESGDSCLIVEVPHPKSVEDSALKVKYEKIRAFIRSRILHGREPGTNGNVIGGRAYVYVTGQLFFDASHSHNQIRGKKGMRSYSLWEIHPIIAMNFAVRP